MSLPPTAERRQWFAVASPGLEDSLEDELRALSGLEDLERVPGGVTFSGTHAGFVVNLESRLATRVWLRVGHFVARHRAVFEKRLAALPFENWVAPNRAVRIEAVARRCRLYHTGLLKDAARTVLVARLGEGSAAAEAGDDDEAGDAARVLIRGDRDTWWISIDSSGARLHRRGWRLQAGAAPLRETLAAGILRLAGYDGAEPLVDPMCGAGTFLLEAAAQASRCAPGLVRDFAFENWPCFSDADRQAWKDLRAEAGRRQPRLAETPAIRVFGADASSAAIARATRNIARAAFADSIQLVRHRVVSRGPSPFPVQPDLGLVVCNPPYGQRLGNRRDALQAIATLGRTLPTWFPGWRAAIVVPNRSWSSRLGLREAQVIPLDNGGLPVFLVTGKWRT